MKKRYEKPLCKVEIFQTNEYCCSCTSNPTFDGTLHVTADTCSNEYYGTGWSGSGFSLDHSFQEANKVAMTATDGNGKKYNQYYWNCMDSDGYYLEYSAGYTDRINDGNDYFILYKESNRKRGLQVGVGASFPTQSQGADTAVAWAKFTRGTVAAS